jgi:hypothetical protein
MIRFLVTTLLTLLGNAIGLLIAAIALPGFQLQPLGFVVSVLFFTGAEVLLKPFIVKMSIKYAPALRGGIALVTTFVGLLLTVWFTRGISIDGLSTWVMAPLIVWLGGVLAGIVLPMVLFKETLARARDARQDDH